MSENQLGWERGHRFQRHGSASERLQQREERGAVDRRGIHDAAEQTIEVAGHHRARLLYPESASAIIQSRQDGTLLPDWCPRVHAPLGPGPGPLDPRVRRPPFLT